ncbi:uncharacterized protein LOC110990948, partial [Acanthaster planci]|uniref:Uncharacterized protein LOC110990948 n=1 Tax=Acanthaster planci TaxID=133434 RepID=A0A8B8A1U9_ACAPL
MMLSAVLKMLLMALMSSGYIPAYCEEILFFERGLQGIVPCNPDASAYSFGDLEFVVWYFPQKELEHVVFLFSQGAVVPQDGISEGQYNISSNFSLIIQNVTDSVEGTYYYKVEPKLGRIYEGSMEVSVKVTTKQPFPIVHECDPQPKAPADTCISHVPHDKVTVSLTCQVDHAKPPVNLQWFRVFDDGHTERVEATPTTKLLVHRPGAFFIDNTYTSLSFLHLLTTSDNNTSYKCEAYGIALGDRNGSHVLVTISKDAFSAHSDQKVYLERGRRGIVPCSPDAAWAYQRGDLQGVYWYFRRRDREHVIFSYFQDATVLLDGIPEGLYDVTSDFSLIIQNVTDSHEGTYYYVVESKVGQIDKGSVEVAIT